MSHRHAHARTCRMNRDLMKETMKRISVSIWPAIRFNPFCVKKSPSRARLLTHRLHAHIIIIIYTVMYTVSVENTTSSTRRSRLFFFLFSLCWFYIGFSTWPVYCCSLQPTYLSILYNTIYDISNVHVLYTGTISMPKTPKHGTSHCLYPRVYGAIVVYNDGL